MRLFSKQKISQQYQMPASEAYQQQHEAAAVTEQPVPQEVYYASAEEQVVEVPAQPAAQSQPAQVAARSPLIVDIVAPWDLEDAFAAVQHDPNAKHVEIKTEAEVSEMPQAVMMMPIAGLASAA